MYCKFQLWKPNLENYLAFRQCVLKVSGFPSLSTRTGPPSMAWKFCPSVSRFLAMPYFLSSDEIQRLVLRKTEKGNRIVFRHFKPPQAYENLCHINLRRVCSLQLIQHPSFD
uniref:Uncharacterized protein n=1 Tax=Sphaerodactylus townsendi TaxID=933632 RepID=A0ACB8F673_9SAUR